MAGSRFKKKNAPIVPSLQLSGQEGAMPSPRGPGVARGGVRRHYEKNKRKESFLNSLQVPPIHEAALVESTSTLPLSTPRGTSSYKDILLTPRMPSHQQQSNYINDRFKMSYASESPRGVTRTRIRRGPMTARAPASTSPLHEAGASFEARRRASGDESASKLIYRLATQVELLERSDTDGNAVARSISKSIQVAASMIGVPVGILEMLQMHEQREMISSIREPRASRDLVPDTPDHAAQFEKIRARISDLEQILGNT